MSRVSPRLLAVLVLTVGSASAARADHPAHAGNDPHGEHAGALALLPADQATHRAKSNGDWADPKTWDNGVPAAGARVLIPECIQVTIRTELEPNLEWVRVEGTLRFTTDAHTRLRVATVLVTDMGTLEIGSAKDRVRPDRTARIVFVPRSRAHRDKDTYDITGGLIALGEVQIFGADRRGLAIPTHPVRKGATRFALAEAPTGWRAGDELLFPAATHDEQDEIRSIKQIAADGKTVTLSAALRSDHAAPVGVTTGVPVGNLTRNVVLESADPDTISNRAHLMFMAHEGVHLSGTLFRGLGRTETTRIHTLPEKRADGTIDPGDNPIGRYAVHFHLRSGASVEKPPLVFAGNVITDCPKHGLVNHGGHVVAENNVTYAIHGSHFFAENGSEVGAFRNNLAVYSKGSGDKVRARDCLFDFGHGGHGFWAQSAAVIMEGNYAFHHAGAGYAVFTRPVREFGQMVRFTAANLPPDCRIGVTGEFTSTGAVPFRFERNAGGNCGKGLEVWNTNTYSDHNVPSVVAGCQFWDTPDGGIDLPYTFNTVVRDTTIVGRPGTRFPTVGVGINNATKFLTLERVSVSGFRVGIDVPVRGHSLVADARLDNDINFRITSPVQPGRRTVLKNNTFVDSRRGDIDYYLADPDCKFNGDLSLLFDRDVLLVEDARFPGRTLYFAEQHPDAVPFPASEVEQLRGKTARQLSAEYGLAVAGSLAPADAVKWAGVRGLVGPVTDDVRRGLTETAAVTFVDDMKAQKDASGEYTLDQNKDRVRFVKGQPGEPSGWRFDTQVVDGRRRTKLAYVDSTAPHFELSPCMKLEIHPDDVKYGIEICGMLHDDVAGKPTCKNMLKEFKDLTVDPDGYVTVNYMCADSVGNATEHTYRFKVTEDAPRRGKNIGYYNQKQYTAEEESPAAAAVAAPPKRSARWWWVGGLGVGLAAGVIRMRMVRQRQAT
jgi:hypothetical protein